MPYVIDQQDLASAFSAGTVNRSGKTVTFEVREVGALNVSSAAIAASDALVEPDPLPFSEVVPNGRHPVTLAIARFDNGDERVAYAQVRFSDAPATVWKMAYLDGQRLERLGPDEYFGYGVDSGTGCFMDPVAGKLLAHRMDIEPNYYETIVTGMEQTYRPTWSWVEVTPSAGHPENIICFSSGFGDGSYPSFFGLDSQGKLSQLVTDFGVLDDQGTTAAPPPPTRKPWWQFWR